MKKILAVMALCFAGSVSAKPILLAENVEKTEQWFGYPGTFVTMSDGYSVLVGQRFKKSKKNEERVFIGVSFKDCSNQFGTLYRKDLNDSNWVAAMTFSFATDTQTVGDDLAEAICAAGTSINNTKPNT